MKKAVSDLHGKSVPELIQDARHYVVSMTANPNFLSPDPSLADVSGKANELEIVYEDALSGDHAKKALMRALTKDLKHLISFLVTYVNIIAKGDVQIILSSGMKANKDPEHSSKLPAPADLRLDKGTNEGMVEARWKTVANAKSYEIEYYESVITHPVQGGEEQQQQGEGIFLGINLEDIQWKQAGIVTSSKFMIKGLNPGNRILVRVVAVNVEGKGRWSDPATMVVP
jgi:hypothetical protein